MSGKFFLIGVCLSIGLYLGGTYVIEKWDSFEIALPDTIQQYLDDLIPSSPPSTTTIYKWQDEKGNLVYGDTPPAGVEHKIVELEGVQSIHIPVVESNESKSYEKETPTKHITPLTPYTDPSKVKQLIDDAKNLQQQSQDRNNQLEQAF